MNTRSLVALTLLLAAVGCSPSTDSAPRDARDVAQTAKLEEDSPYLDTARFRGRVVGRVDTTSVPDGVTLRVRLARTSERSNLGVRIPCTDGAFVFEGVPSDDWYVIVDAQTPSASWWWCARADDLGPDETRDLGTLALQPTVLRVRSRIEHAPGAGPEAVDPRRDPYIRLLLHPRGAEPLPFQTMLEGSTTSIDHVFHGLPRGDVDVTSQAFTPTSLDQRLVRADEDTRVELGDAPVESTFVHTVESGPVPRPHARLNVPPGRGRADVEWNYSSVHGEIRGGAGPGVQMNTLDQLAHAYLELDPGTTSFAAMIGWRDEHPALFYAGVCEVEAGLNIGQDFEAVPSVRVRLVLPATETLETMGPPKVAPPDTDHWLATGGTWSAPDVDATTGERSYAECWMPVGWLARVDERSESEWLIPAEGGVVRPRPVQ